MHVRVCETEGAPGRVGGCGTLCKGGLPAGRAPNLALYLTWAVARPPCVPGHPQCPPVTGKQTQDVFCSLVHLISPYNTEHSNPASTSLLRATESGPQPLLCTPQASPWHGPWKDHCHFFPPIVCPRVARAGSETSVSFPSPPLLLIFCLPLLPWR